MFCISFSIKFSLYYYVFLLAIAARRTLLGLFLSRPFPLSTALGLLSVSSPFSLLGRLYVPHSHTHTAASVNGCGKWTLSPAHSLRKPTKVFLFEQIAFPLRRDSVERWACLISIARSLRLSGSKIHYRNLLADRRITVTRFLIPLGACGSQWLGACGSSGGSSGGVPVAVSDRTKEWTIKRLFFATF